MTTRSFDLETARLDTPGCESVIHFNNAGASLCPEPVLDAVISHLRLESQIGGYEAAAREQERIESVYGAIGRLLGCGTEEIAVVENATRAWDMAFYSIPFQAGQRILTCRSEYASNYIAFLQAARRYDLRIDLIPNDEHGSISIDALREQMDTDVRLIAICHVPTNSGLINPAEEIGQVAMEADCLYLVDACQSVGQIPIDVEAMGCDFLSGTGRKYLRGPRGTGFLFVRSELIESLEPPFLDLHAATWTQQSVYSIRKDARRFESWESYIAGKIGLGMAVEYALGWGMDIIRARVQDLAHSLRTRLLEIPGVIVQDRGLNQCGLVTFIVKDVNPSEITNALLKRCVNVSVTKQEATRIDMEDRGLDELIRASVHYYNSAEEIDVFCEHLESVITALS
jgi:selenocysteine lyase/cysteine desulfurase